MTNLYIFIQAQTKQILKTNVDGQQITINRKDQKSASFESGGITTKHKRL